MRCSNLHNADNRHLLMNNSADIGRLAGSNQPRWAQRRFGNIPEAILPTSAITWTNRSRKGRGRRLPTVGYPQNGDSGRELYFK